MDILPNLNAARILVVEADLTAADKVVKLLRAAGYNIQNAYNIGDALAADHSRFDLALINSTMRDRSGQLLVTSIHQHPTFGRLPVINLNEFSPSELLERIQQVLIQRKPSARRPTEPLSRIRHLEPKPYEEEVATQPTRVALDARLQQQLGELKTLSSLGRSISSLLELSEVLNQIVEAATTLTHAEEGLLLLPDEEGKALYIRAMKGVDDDSARNFRVKTEDPIVGGVYKTGEPALVADRGWQRVKTEYFVKSLVYVPLTLKGKTIGVLGVNNRLSERAFTRHDQELLLDLAAHAAIAIENAQLYEESIRQNRQLSTLVEAGQAVNSTLSLEDVLSTICQQIIMALAVHGCMINQLSLSGDNEGELHPLANARCAVWRGEQGPVTQLSERPVLHEALSQNAFYIVNRNQQGRPEERELLEREGAESLVMIPVRAGNQPAIGTLELYYRNLVPEITSEFRGLARASALEILALIVPRTPLPPLSIIRTAANHLLQGTQADGLVLSVLSGGQKLVRVVECSAGVFLDETRPYWNIYPTDVNAFGDGEPLIFHSRDSEMPAPARATMTAFGAEAMLCLPLMVKGIPFGTVTIYDTLDPRQFQQREIDLAWALITQAATAIENARLYRDLQQSMSDLREAQASLVQAARLSTMGELAAVVAHQINNPLTTIMADAELAMLEVPPDGELYEGLTAIYRAGQRAHAVVKRLLSTARRGAPSEPLQRISVHETMHNTLELVTMHIERSRIALKIKLDEAHPGYTMAAPGHLEDLWLNLLLNARDALIGGPNATIWIESHCSARNVTVLIRDNAQGIPPDKIPHIFEPFYTTKSVGEGTGLGLYICKQIVDQCHGTIRVESIVGQGTTFQVKLPIPS